MRNIFPLLLVLCLPMLSSAHHSTNVNFTQEIISVDGVIEQVRNMNPHVSVLIKHIDTSGAETYWLLETVGRTTLDRQGISMAALEIGVKVTATGRKGRRENTMYLQKLLFADGQEFTPEPDR